MSETRKVHTLKSLHAELTYDFDRRTDEFGVVTPQPAGHGKYAKVYRAVQSSSGHAVQFVAIKVLRETANNAAERQFQQESGIQRELIGDSGGYIGRTLDILSVKPMVMCGCGEIYHPACPRGCGVELRRKDNNKDPYPSLLCDRCGYELSAKDVKDRMNELLTRPANVCCGKGGTLINFVEREVVVMELHDSCLDGFPRRRREVLQRFCAARGVPADRRRSSGSGATWVHRSAHRWRAEWEQNRDGVLAQKVILLEKVRMMVQIAQAVEYLHNQKEIIHKDLAPDNIMIRFHGRPDRFTAGDQSATLGGERGRSLRDELHNLVLHPDHEVQVIDFGLSDKHTLTRSWYEEEVPAGDIKHPFLSPEAKMRKLRIKEELAIEESEHRFRIPESLRGRLMESDIIADERDYRHNHDLEIWKIEPSPDGHVYAYFRGDPPKDLSGQQFERIYRLGEAHDIYALGALFYYILTEDLEEVEQLGGLVTGLGDVPYDLTPTALSHDRIYNRRREAIRVPYWRDELMVLILRAMVRGQARSFVKDRTERGPRAAQLLLAETKKIYLEIQREILAAPRVTGVQRVAVAAVAGAALFGLVLGGVTSRLMRFDHAVEPTTHLSRPAADRPIVHSPGV